nr:hypothetical protein [Tanacetum cinerariifolium]
MVHELTDLVQKTLHIYLMANLDIHDDHFWSRNPYASKKNLIVMSHLLSLKSSNLESSDGGNTGDEGKTFDREIGACCGGIGDSLLVAFYACMTFIYGSSWKGEMASEAKRYLDKSSEGSEEVFLAGSENRHPMLNKENYVPWSSRLLRYAKSRPNGKLIHNSIINGPYVRRMIPKPGDSNREVPVNETFHVQTDDELTEKELKQIEADDQAI